MRATQRAGMMKYLLNTLIGADGFDSTTNDLDLVTKTSRLF